MATLNGDIVLTNIQWDINANANTANNPSYVTASINGGALVPLYRNQGYFSERC